MIIPPQAIYNLVAGPRPPREGEQWEWRSEEHQRHATTLIQQALEQIRSDLADAWIKREIEGAAFEAIAPTRQRGREIVARAQRRLRGKLVHAGVVGLLRESFQTTYIPDGPFDPAWLLIKEAAAITELSAYHLRHLARTGKVESRVWPRDKSMVQLLRSSLRAWVESGASRGKKKGVWHE